MSNTALKPKEFYLERILSHEKADEVIRGTGWDDKEGKGCSIGCTLNNYNHEAYEEAGIGPQWLARVQDTLFEGMSQDKAKTWTSAIVLSIPDHLHGDTKNTLWDKMKAKYLVMILKSTLENFDHAKFPKTKECVDASIALWEREDIGSPEWSAAARSGYWAAAEAAAAEAAVAAARSGYWSAEAAAAEAEAAAARSGYWSAEAAEERSGYWAAAEAAAEAAAVAAARSGYWAAAAAVVVAAAAAAEAAAEAAAAVAEARSGYWAAEAAVAAARSGYWAEAAAVAVAAAVAEARNDYWSSAEAAAVARTKKYDYFADELLKILKETN